MNKDWIIKLLEDQLRYANEQNHQFCQQLSSQSILIDKLSSQVATLTHTVESLEEALLVREASLEKESKTKALGKFFANKSEKITPDASPGPVVVPPPSTYTSPAGQQSGQTQRTF